MDIIKAKKATKLGAIVAAISSFLTLALVVYAVTIDAQDGHLGYWNDLSLFFDVALIFGCAIGMYRHSRFASVAFLIYYMVDTAIRWVDAGRPTGLGVALFFVFLFSRTAIAAFVYHRLRREEDPDYRAYPKWSLFLWVPAGVVVFAICVGSVLLVFAPPVETVTGDQLSPRHYQTLISNQVIDEDELVQLFYSAGMFSIMEDGNMVTDSHVISYQELDDGGWLERAPYSQVVSAKISEKGDFLEDSFIQINLRDGTEFVLCVPASDGQDTRFLAEIEARLTAEEKEPVENDGTPASD